MEPRSPARTTRSARIAGCPLLLTVVPLLGCQQLPPLSNPTSGTQPTSTGRWASGPGAPALEDIFLRPGIHGVAPVIRSVSADARWLLFEHRALERAESGRLRLEPGPALRLVGLDGDGLPALDAPTVAGLLPDPAPDTTTPDQVLTAWSPTGHRLLLARDRDVFLHDPETSRQRLLLGGEEAPWKRLRSIVFERGGEAVLVSDGTDEWRADLPPSTWPATRLELRRWKRQTPAGLVPSRHLRWSDDRSVVARLDGPVLRIEAPLPGALLPFGPLVRHASERALPHQIAHLEDGRIVRAVELEGRAGMPWCEDLGLSPDGRHVLGLEMDRRRDPERTLIPDYLTERVRTRTTRAKWADDGPSPYRIWVWDTETGARQELEPPDGGGPLGDAGFVGPDWWTSGLGWAPQPVDGPTPDGDDAEASPSEPLRPPARAAFSRRSADHRNLEVWTWSEGELRQVWRDHDERWIGGPVRQLRWSQDGRHLLVGSESTEHSSTPGRAQLFAVDVENGAVRQLTEVAGEVGAFGLFEDGSVVVRYSDADPATRRLGWLSPQVVRGAAAPRLRDFPQPEGGWHEAPFVGADAAPGLDGRPPRVVFLREELGVPAEIWVSDAAGARAVTATVPEPYLDVDWIRPVRFRGARTETGQAISANVFLPRGVELDEPGDGPRATIVFVHGAGYLQNVTDSMTRYEVNLLFHSRLAERGYVVVDVDYRGSRGYGNAFRTGIQYRMGGTDLDDIHAVLDALAERGLVDPGRVGLYGGSYGGFLTMMALFTAPERWSVGAALRSVTDWRTYNPWYTQPRLGRPSSHPEAYRLSSPIDHYQGLEDPLLILHGMVDDNVFAQDSIRLIELLIGAGKDFDAMLYPSQNHAFTDGDSWLDEYRRIEEYLTEHLGPPLAPE